MHRHVVEASPVAPATAGTARGQGGAPAAGGWASRWPMWLGAVVFLLPVLGVGFLNDDFVGLVHFAPRGWAGVLDEFHPHDFEFLRPLGFLLFRVELTLFGTNPFLFHLAHLALFVLAAWLAGRLAVRLCRTAAPGWASALALVYPGRTEVVAWIAAVFDLLAVLLATWALLLATAPGWGGRRWRAVGLAALCFVAPLAKESAYALPVVIVAWELLGVMGTAPRPTRVVRCAAACAGAGGALVYRIVALGGIGGYKGVPLVPGAAKLASLPEMLLRLFFSPVNPTYGVASHVVSALCIAAAVVVGVAFWRGDWRRGLAPVGAGIALAASGLLPALPYIDPGTLAWQQSRFVGLAGVGVALAAAVALGYAPRRWAVLAGALLFAAWAAATTLNEFPWLGAARARDALLARIEENTRSAGPHWVWVGGPINDYRGAQLLGGRLAEAVELAMPGRAIHVDSEFLQRRERRPVGPPAGVPPGALVLLRLEPSPLRVVEVGGRPGAPPPGRAAGGRARR